MKAKIISVICTLITLSGCGISSKIDIIESAQSKGTIRISEDITPELSTDTTGVNTVPDTMTVTGMEGEKLYVMRRIMETSEYIHASENLSGAVVYASFKNIAERCGKIELSFDITIPKELQDPSWQIRFTPILTTLDDTLSLEKIHITGSEYRKGQLKGYELYSKYLSSIITDSTELRYKRLIEIFIERYLPDLAALKTDSTKIPDHIKESYSLSYQTVLNHYRKRLKIQKNNERARMVPSMYEKYIKDPLDTSGIKLDSVITECRDIEYTYRERIKAPAGVKKLEVYLKGDIKQNGEIVYEIPPGTPISFYISSLSALAEISDTITEKPYSDGMRALLSKDYQRAIDLLAPYKDMNSAIAYACMGYYEHAGAILESLPNSAKRDYVLAIVYARRGNEKRAMESYLHSIEMEEKYRFRANLDPEISSLINNYNITTFNH